MVYQVLSVRRLLYMLTTDRSRSFPNPMQLGRMLALSVGLLGLTFTQPVFADNEPMTRTLTVTGQGTERIPTTLTQVQLGVEARGETAEAVQREVARRSSAVVDLLRSRNVQRLQTTGISLNPVYNYTNNEQRLAGYQATNTVSFQLPTEQTGTLLDDSVRAGASRIDSVSFTASDEALTQARQQALRKATSDAQEQADAVLAALGLQREEVVTIQIGGQPPIVRPLMRAAPAALAADASTPVVGGEQQVEASVTLQFRY